jgi:hypothetical protein
LLHLGHDLQIARENEAARQRTLHPATASFFSLNQDKDESEEAEAVQYSDGTLRCDPVHRPEPRQKVRAEAKQPRDITKNEMHSEDGFRRYLASQNCPLTTASRDARERAGERDRFSLAQL